MNTLSIAASLLIAASSTHAFTTDLSESTTQPDSRHSAAEFPKPKENRLQRPDNEKQEPALLPMEQGFVSSTDRSKNVVNISWVCVGNEYLYIPNCN